MSESTKQYVNRVGSKIAQEHYESEIKSKLAAIAQIESLYEEGESLEAEDEERIQYIRSLISGYQQIVAQIESSPFVEQPAVITKNA
jgi:hypothetical protein